MIIISFNNVHREKQLLYFDYYAAMKLKNIIYTVKKKSFYWKKKLAAVIKKKCKHIIYRTPC